MEKAYWAEVLKAQHPQSVKRLEELRQRLSRAVRGYFRRRPHVVAGLDATEVEALVEDVVADALLAIRSSFDQFRGESRFSTWAFQIAINRAAREARRKRWLRHSLDVSPPSELPPLAETLEADGSTDPEAEIVRAQIWRALDETLREDLTERQRSALVRAFLDGVPMEALAEEMQTNRNALYKLIHDARAKLRQGMERRGWSAEAALDQFEPERLKG